MTGYTDTIRRYAMDDRFTGNLTDPDGIGEVGLGADEAGSRLAVRFALRLTAGVIAEIRYQVFGCGFTLAACAAAAELAAGRSLPEVRTLSPAAIDRCLGGLPSERDYCAELAVEALLSAAASAGSREPQAVRARLVPQAEAGKPLAADDPLFRALLASPAPDDLDPADRRLFAGLLAVATREPRSLETALNLSPQLLDILLSRFFPAIDRGRLFASPPATPAPAPAINREVERLLGGHVPDRARGWQRVCAELLARIIAARAARPGHLWVAMGLLERAELSAAIGRHLPGLLTANQRGMRWKRFLFRQVCEQNGGTLCQAPVCGDCSDYALCFDTEGESAAP